MVQVGESVDYYYRGPRSVRFWERIDQLANNNDLYKLGVKLQNLEEYVLGELLKAEKRRK
ncbi:hypothetical protein LCGC14_2215180 [marine sediment metagenome]|uniref:Uncharacterized protein n=1 Tax=marine sediment metagenome TaxID=412755 RepID=A0A0F9FQA3_9ZZZZ